VGWTSGVLIPSRGRDFLSLHHHIQTVTGAHPPSYLTGTSGSFPGSEVVGA